MHEHMPVVFVGHGTPMNAIRDTPWSRAWAEWGQRLPRPRAVLSISAHWYVPQTAATAMAAPPTIHDFYGFPQALFGVRYPAPGDPALAARLQQLLAPTPVVADSSWGLDHGTWSVLRHMFPAADVPVVQLSIDSTAPAAAHYALGQRLRPLRDEGVLILGSGNVVHNLRAYAWGAGDAPPLDWAARFDARITELIQGGNYDAVANYRALGPDAVRAAPTPEHFLPLLYVLGAAEPGAEPRFPVRGIDGGALSMLSVQLG